MKSKDNGLTPLERTQKVLDVSATERGTFRTCRRRWELTVLDNLTPTVPESFDLQFGAGMHEALETYYSFTPNGPDTQIDNALNTWDDWYENEAYKIERARIDETYRTGLLNHLVELGDLGEEMLNGYHVWAQPEDRFTVHAVEGVMTPAGESWLRKHNAEREFHSEHSLNSPMWDRASRRLLVPILDPEKQMPLRGRPMLSMRIDLLVHRIDPGMKGLWVYDHKTTSGSPKDRQLDYDDQITSYCYGVWRWLGIMPRGACFSYLVKRPPKEPRILKKGNLSTAKDQLTTPDQYRAELRKRGLMLKDGTIKDEKYRDAYSALLSRGWDPFFKRFYATRNKEELLQFEYRLFEEYQDMRDGYKGELALYPNFNPPHMPWCNYCPVSPICMAMEDGSDVDGIIESRFEQAPDRKAERLEW